MTYNPPASLREHDRRSAIETDIATLAKILGGHAVTRNDPGARSTTASQLARVLEAAGCEPRAARAFTVAMVEMVSGAEEYRDRLRAQEDARRERQAERLQQEARDLADREVADRFARQAARDELELEARRLGRLHRERGMRDVHHVVHRVKIDRPELAELEVYIRLGFEGADERAASDALKPQT